MTQENVDFVLYDGNQEWRAGEIDWNGAVYTDLVENRSVELVDEETVYSSEEWRNLSPPEYIREDVSEDPRRNLVCCRDPAKRVESVHSVKGIAYNQRMEKMIPGKENAVMVCLDFFQPVSEGIMEWNRAITQLNSDEPAFYKSETVSYDESELNYGGVAEGLAEVGFKKQRPELEEVIDYSQERKPVSEIDSLHFTNRSFVDELT